MKKQRHSESGGIAIVVAASMVTLFALSALAALAGETLSLRAELIAEDGSAFVTGAIEGTIGDDLGPALAADLLDRAPDAVRRLFAA